jgi:hypothetical protein
MISDCEFLIKLRALCINRSYFRYSVYFDRVDKILYRVIEWDFFNFNIVCVLFRFSIVAVADYIYGVRVSSVYVKEMVT